MSSSPAYHRPVMLRETVEALQVKEAGVYVDATLGGGGHSRYLKELAPGARLVAFDKDPEAHEEMESWAASMEGITPVQADYRYLKRYLRLYGMREVDGIMADLGVSSHQIDTGSRGFSIRESGPLDMRMDKQGPLKAEDILNQYDKRKLVEVLSKYGEVRNAKTLGQAILAQRAMRPFQTTSDLVAVAQRVAPRNKENRYLAQVFQALRIEVNDELEGLKDFLTQATEMLKVGGRIAVLTYHSLEDRPVKRFFKHGNFAGQPKKDLYGNPIKALKEVYRKPIQAPAEELAQNPRARSAKLRVAEKIPMAQ